MKVLRAVTAATLLALAPLGCGAIISALPAVIAVVTDAMQIIDAIADFVDRYFKQHPDPEKEAKVHDAITKCRASLNVALRTAKGTQDLSDAKTDAAFEEFRHAYQELLVIVDPLGVKAQRAGNFSATPNGLVVPEPLAMSRVSK